MRLHRLKSVPLAAALLFAQGRDGALLTDEARNTEYDPSECYRVHDLSIRRADIRLYLTSGYLTFSKPVHGYPMSAIFTTDVEGGDGEVLLLPPNRGERRSMARFTESPNLDEHLSTVFLLFTDDTAKELRDQIAAGAGTKAPEMGPSQVERWSPVLHNLSASFELRLAQDLLNPRNPSRGLLFATVAGKRLGTFDLLYNPTSTEQIIVGRLNDHDGRSAYDVWASFSPRDPALSRPAPLDFLASRYSIDATVEQGKALRARTQVQIRTGPNPIRVLSFDAARSVDVTSATVDGKPAEVLARDSLRSQALRPDDNQTFLVVVDTPLAADTDHTIVFEHTGTVVREAGNGVYYVGARSNWYPHAGDHFAYCELTFHYPRKLTLVAPGDMSLDSTDGEVRTSRWTTPSPVRVAGFNLGEYDKVDASLGGFQVTVYGNRHLETALQPRAPDPVIINTPGRGRPATILSQATPPQPDPSARLRAVAADVSAALQFFSERFGPPSMKTLTVSPVPGAFGQGFPGLLYLSTLVYMNPSEWPASMRNERSRLLFTDLIESHEVAHQWWGNVVTPSSSQDEWIQEGLADYCSLLWLEKKKGVRALDEVLDLYREDLLRKGANGQTVESFGPITWGFRLEAGDPDSWRAITYEKGAWIFHMLRRRLGDDKFLAMLTEVRKRFEFQAITTRDLVAVIKDFRPAGLSASAIDEFFDNWAFSTGVPSFKLNYSIKGTRVTGSVAVSGVDNDFVAQVPVEIQFAKSQPRTIWVEASTDEGAFSTTLPETPLKLSIPNSVLAARR